MAIKEENGRFRSERTKDEVLELLKSEMDALTPDEKEALLLLLKELDDPAFTPNPNASSVPPRILDAMMESEYLRPVVDIQTFVKDPYYLGDTCSNTYPRLVSDLEELFSGGYREAVLGGAIGAGKTTFASIAICRCLYEMSCLRDPHRTFGIAKDTNIAFVVLSVTEELAIKVAFENIATKLLASPYFRENFPFKDTKRELRFPHGVWVAARASTDTSSLGLNCWGIFMDEVNFLNGSTVRKNMTPGRTDKAQSLYDQLVRRMKSRFNNRGKLPGITILVSSKRTKDDFTARRLQQSKNDPDIFSTDYATWDLKPDNFSPIRFSVLVGNEIVPSRILAPEEVEAVRSKLSNGMLIVDIPEDFRRDFEADIDGSVRDIAGISTVSISPFIQQRDKILQCIDKSRSHPFPVIEWDQTKGGTFLWDKLSAKAMIRDGAEVVQSWQPIHYPGVTRHIHIDPSIKNDATGFACGCVIGYTQVERRSEETGDITLEPAPVIWVDFMLRIIPPVGGEIDFGMVRSLVYQLREHGFPVGYVSMDQFNSVSSLQKFATLGIEAERISVDRPMDAYDTLKAAIYDGRIHMYHYEPVLHELRELQRDNVKMKIDHQPNGKKDVSDALCGIVWTLTTKYRGAPLGIIKGLSQSKDPDIDQQKEMVNPNDMLFPFITG